MQVKNWPRSLWHTRALALNGPSPASGPRGGTLGFKGQYHTRCRPKAACASRAPVAAALSSELLEPGSRALGNRQPSLAPAAASGAYGPSLATRRLQGPAAPRPDDGPTPRPHRDAGPLQARVRCLTRRDRHCGG
jgi:hypothetical protein